MSDQLVESIVERLNEEKWTRATLNNYTVTNFHELDELIQQVYDAEQQDEVLEACEEHLAHTPNSIVALYVSGIIKITEQSVDDANLVSLIEIFSDNRKWGIVRYLCERILDFGENKFALRTLAETYNNENQPEKVHETWERLIRVDYDEADIVKQLAAKKEDDADLDEAIRYYKKALHRYINHRSFANIKEIWHKLVRMCPQETEFFAHAERRIAKMISEERAIQLLEDLYPQFKTREHWKTGIDILKRILGYDPRNPWARKEIIECYRSLYAHHSHLEEYIKLSNLNQSWRNVHDAIADFEKHISFDKGNFVYHRSWGVGLIRDIGSDEITIDFVKKRGHTMSLKMAVSALTILPKNHIWVLKSTTPKEKLRKQVKTDPAWALRIVLGSMEDGADIKKIKSELVPSVLSPSEWTSWSSKAREMLRTDESFGIHPRKPDHYVVRDQPITFEEKVFNKFQAARGFFDRVKIIGEFMRQIENRDNAGADADYFQEMFDYFVAYLKGGQRQVNEYVVASNLLVRRIVANHPYLNPDIDLDFRTLFESIENVEQVFAGIENVDLKREFLHQLRNHVKGWAEWYVRLFPYFLNREVISELEEADRQEEVRKLYRNVIDNYRDYREAYVWICRNSLNEQLLADLRLSYEKMLINLIHLLDITFRDISNKKDVAHNRKLNKQIQTFLFKDEHLLRYVLEADEDAAQRLFTLVEDVKELDPSVKLSLRHRIKERYPSIRFMGEDDRSRVNRGGFIVTPKQYEQKQRELQHIHDVEVPNSSKEIAAAREYGDLRENAEYKAAKERQDHLNNTAARLKDELERATVMQPHEVDSNVISFGTVVKLYNKRTKETEEYTILGPWESDPERSIISYQSPLGIELYNHKAGDELHFVINDRTYSYRVEDIRPADFNKVS